MSEQIEIIRVRAKAVAEQRVDMQSAATDHQDAGGELLAAVLALAPALEAVCTAIPLGGKTSIWRGLLLGERTYAKSDNAAGITHRLYVDQNHRLLRVQIVTGTEPTVTPITMDLAVREFAVDLALEAISRALAQQLQGKMSERTKQFRQRADAIRGIVALVQTSRLTWKP
jgi:hypothetical protein